MQASALPIPTSTQPSLTPSSLHKPVHDHAHMCGKHIVVFCDGSGQDGLTTSEYVSTGAEENQGQTRPRSAQKERYPTNVHRLSRCVPGVIENNPSLQQIVFYQSGVGAGNDFGGADDWADKYELVRGTSTGSKIRDTYNFIAQNYVDGDKIFLFGFSRGAYTARKVAGLIALPNAYRQSKIGLLHRRHMGSFFKYWRQLDDNQDINVSQEYTRRVDIEFLGVWDTVGSVFGDLTKSKRDALNLIDAELPGCVKVARHALAWHESRKEFLPTPFSGFKDKDVKQAWFPGAHSDVGGSYKERLIADISLCWMAGEAKSSGLILDEEFLFDLLTNLGGTQNPKLAIHFERHPRGKGFLGTLRFKHPFTVDRMTALGEEPTMNEKKLLELKPEFLYHKSLWANASELGQPAENSLKVFPRQGTSLDPEIMPLNELEKQCWERNKWDELLGRQVPRARARGGGASWETQSPPSKTSLVYKNPIEFEMMIDYVQDMVDNDVFKEQALEYC